MTFKFWKKIDIETLNSEYTNIYNEKENNTNIEDKKELEKIIQKNSLKEEELWVIKDKRYKIVKKIVLTIYLILFFIFIKKIYDYSENNIYEDDFVTIKEINIWYNVYNKWNLQDLIFFNWNITNENNYLYSYIKDNLLFLETKDNFNNWNTHILSKPTNIKSKTEKYTLDNIYIKNIYKYNQNEFLLLYTKYNFKNNTYKYCFFQNQIIFDNEENNFCILETKELFDFVVNKYKEYYLIWLNDKIYFFNKNTQNIEKIIKLKSQILSLEKNNNSIKIETKNWLYNISNTYIEYYLIKRIHSNQKIIIVNIDDYK